MKMPVPEKKEPKLVQEQVFFSWQAYLRPFEKKSKEFYLNSGAVLAVISLIIFIAEGWVPVVLLIALSFLYFILHNVEPEKVEYKITNFGVRIKDNIIPWENIISFWIEEEKDYNKLILGTNFIPGKMEIVTEKKDKEKIESVLKNYVVKQPIPPSSLEKLAGWFSAKMQNR
jgi:hypothetical protein